MIRQNVTELTDEFFRSAVTTREPSVDTSDIVIPPPRTIDQIINDKINTLYHNKMARLNAVLESASAFQAERAASQAERAAFQVECHRLSKERDAIANHRKELNTLLEVVHAERERLSALRKRVVGYCTPSRIEAY